MIWISLVALLPLSILPAIEPADHAFENAQLSIITCAPWQGELYTAFGHSAIRIYEPERGLNHIFNYGVFDFKKPYFYLNFARGNLLYELNVSPYPDFLYTYIYRNSTVSEQILDLTPLQKQRVFEYLQWNAQPENRNYFYDYFYDNCATRIRDVFVKTLSTELKFDSSFLQTDYTIRQLAEQYLSHQPWGDLGIDICLGLPMDKHASYYEYMFIPNYIEHFFDSATLISMSEHRPLVAEKKIIFKAKPEKITHRFWHPWVVFGGVLLLVAGVSFYDLRRGKILIILDIALLSITGLIGCLLILLWTITNHKASANNFNLLWALPFNIVIAFMLLGRRQIFLVRYFGFAFFISIMLLLTWFWLPQELNVFIMPLVLSLSIRYGTNYWIRKQNTA